MSERKILVPEGMLKAAQDAFALTDEDTGGHVAEVLEAALRWLSDNPPAMKRFDFNPHDGEQGMEESADGEYVLHSDFSRMFLSPDPDEPIKDLMWSETLYSNDTGFYKALPNINESIRQAYRRGKEAKCQKP